MTTVAMSTIRIAVTIPMTINMVETSLAALLSDGGFVVVFDDKLESPIVCSIVSSTNAILTCSAGSELHTKVLSVLT